VYSGAKRLSMHRKYAIALRQIAYERVHLSVQAGNPGELITQPTSDWQIRLYDWFARCQFWPHAE
jgi:hypothetical protein